MPQSTHASAPSMRGLRVRGLALHGTPANLSAPLTANRRHRASWSADRMLAQNWPSSAITGQVDEDRDTLSDTNGGSSDSEAKDWMDSPAGRPLCMAAMITIPDAKWPSVVRKSGVPYAVFTEPVNDFCIYKSNFDLTKMLAFWCRGKRGHLGAERLAPDALDHPAADHPPPARPGHVVGVPHADHEVTAGSAAEVVRDAVGHAVTGVAADLGELVAEEVHGGAVGLHGDAEGTHVLRVGARVRRSADFGGRREARVDLPPVPAVDAVRVPPGQILDLHSVRRFIGWANLAHFSSVAAKRRNKWHCAAGK